MRRTRTMAAVDAIDGVTGSLVIQITVWREGETIRARLWTDATGDSEVSIAGSEEELLAFVRRAIVSWSNVDEP